MGITSTMGFRTNFNRTMGERRKVIAHAATATLTVGESGSMITTEGSSGAVVLTLPAVASSTGCYYWFVNGENQDMTITAPANLMVTFNDPTATSVKFGTSSEKTGGGVFAYCDGVKWFVQLMTYDGADQLVTVA
jgi:hypothetical protein